MSYSGTEDVAIIGAGLAGLTLALALHQQSIPATVYESRPAPLNIGGAVMLSPNALRILDALGIYGAVRDQGYSFDALAFRDAAGRLVETQEFGSESKYGYQGLRIYRHILIDALVAALKEKGVPVRYGAKFARVVEDAPRGVTFALADGTTRSAAVLVGADGLHSTVRRHLYPDLEPKFIGMAGITAAVPTAQCRFPPGYHLPVTVMTEAGAFVAAPQTADGSEVLIGKQQRISPDAAREPGWDRAFVADKESAVRFLQQGNEPFPDFVRSAMEHIDPAKVNKWPFFVVPKLERWTSDTHRVLIVGDAAHAIPPSAGQGINQAFEDVYMLALLLGARDRVGGRADAALAFWQSYRQARVDKVLDLNKQIDLRRMPKGDAVADVQREDFDLGWLYKPDFKQDVEEWISRSG